MINLVSMTVLTVVRDFYCVHDCVFVHMCICVCECELVIVVVTMFHMQSVQLHYHQLMQQIHQRISTPVSIP